MAINSNSSTNISFQKINSGIIFLVIAAVYVICNLIWWQINTPVIPTNTSALHFLDIFSTKWFYYNAPLITWIMKFMFSVFGQGNWDLQIIIVNYIFFLIPLYFIYKIGIELKDKETGKIAMILFALTPAVYAMSRQYGHMDYHIIAGITFNIYCLIKTDYFKNIKWTICYGISTGLGLMIKDAFLAYFFAPWLYITIQSLKNNTVKLKIINIFLTIIFASLIAGPHYFRTEIIKKILYEPVTNTVSVFSFENMRVMTIGLWEELLSPPIFLIFVVALVWFLIKYRSRYKIILLLWLLIPWGILMLMRQYKLSEYGAGFIPAMILIASVYLSHIKKKLIKSAILLLIILIGILQFYIFSYMPELKFSNIGFKFKGHYISYYNNKFNFYNGVVAKQIYNLVSNIKLKYHTKSIYLEVLDYNANRVLQMFAAKEKLNMLTLDDWTWNHFFNKKRKKEINLIIYVGEKTTSQNKINILMEVYDDHVRLQKIPRQEYLNSIMDKLQEFDMMVKTEFKTVEVWAPKNNEEGLKVEFLERINNNK